MKAMILAAGLGSRLGKITEQTPKCLVQAGGVTLLEHVVESLKRAGVTDVVINLYHLGDQIKEFVQLRRNFGINVSFAQETELLGTGGGVKNAKSLLAGVPYFFIHNSDVYTDLDLGRLAKAHEQGDQIATLAVMNRDSDRALLFDSGELIGWRSPSSGTVVREVANPTPVGFSGIQIVSPDIFNYMQDEATFSIITTYLNAVKAGKAVRAFSMDEAYWIDAGTPERLERLRGKIEAGQTQLVK